MPSRVGGYLAEVLGMPSRSPWAYPQGFGGIWRPYLIELSLKGVVLVVVYGQLGSPVS